MIKSTKIKIHIKHIWKKILVLLTISNKKPPIQSNQFSTTIQNFKRMLPIHFNPHFLGSQIIHRTHIGTISNIQRDINTYKNSIQTIWDNAINYTQRVNDAALIDAEFFTNSIEIVQRYYDDSVQNYFDFLKKIERCTLKISGQFTVSRHLKDIKQIDN